MTRQIIFDAVRAARNKPWTPADIAVLDAALDRLGVARPEASDGAHGGTLRPSRKALELIKSFEGCKLEAYPDPGSGGDPWTIGWGSTGPGIRKGVVWTQQQADERFASDVADEYGAAVARLIGNAATTQGEFDAMVSLTYNIGVGNFQKSTLLQKHKAGDKAGAAAEFGRWNKAAGKVLPGLTRRRAAEAALYRGAA